MDTTEFVDGILAFLGFELVGDEWVLIYHLSLIHFPLEEI